MPRNLWILLGASLALTACGDKGNSNETNGTSVGTDSVTGGSTGDVTTTGVTTSVGSTTSSSGTAGSTGAGTTGGSDTCGAFICPPDSGGGINECDPWEQDCPDGEKCMPWANDGGNSWNATKCSPVDENPGQIGDECTVEGSGVSGVDSCDVGSMCYYVDPETGTGVCVSFCQGSEADPMCDPGFVCTIANNGVLILCRAECDPLLQDCDGNAACLPASGSDRFTCIIDASGDMGIYGDPCEYINVCDPGLFCAAADVVPDCQGASGCCTEFCDLNAADPNAACSGTAGGAECVPWYEAGMEVPGLEHVGACVIPA